MAINKEEVESILYSEYMQNNKILFPKEIEDKNLVKRSVLKRIYGKLDIDLIWQSIAKKYNCKIPTLEESEKIDLIERLKKVAKIEGEPVNSKLHRDLYCKGCKLFNSWREFNMIAGLKVQGIKTATLNSQRKDEILEKLILISINNKFYKKNISDYKNMPTVKTLEKIYNNSWDDLLIYLGIIYTDSNPKYVYSESDELLKNISNIIKTEKIKTFNDYIFSKKDTIPFIYLINKLVINFEWLQVLIRNKFKNCKSDKFKYTKEEILNILSFKKEYFQRQLSGTEINNDVYLPNVIDIMKILNKSIYEIWGELDKNGKYILKKR